MIESWWKMISDFAETWTHGARQEPVLAAFAFAGGLLLVLGYVALQLRGIRRHLRDARRETTAALRTEAEETGDHLNEMIRRLDRVIETLGAVDARLDNGVTPPRLRVDAISARNLVVRSETTEEV